MKDNNIRCSGFVKKVMEKLASNSMALKGKLRAIETRLIIFYLLRDKKALSLGSNDSHKLKNHSRQQEKYLNQTSAVDSNTIVLHNSVITSANTEEKLAKAPEEEEEVNLMCPVLDDVNNKEERDGSNAADEGGNQLRVEDDDVDRMADLFIRRFHQQMRLQRLNS